MAENEGLGERHRHLVSVDFTTDIDPNRVEEWARENFDVEEVAIEISDLERGGSNLGVVVYDKGPLFEELIDRD